MRLCKHNIVKALGMSLMLSLLVPAVGFAALPQKPADLPARYRDFKAYSTSEPDAKDPSRIVVTVQLRNEGDKPLKTRARLTPNVKAGFKGGATEVVLKPHSEAKWTLDLRPAADLGYEVLTGDITFGNVRERELYIAVQGPDPADFQMKGIQKITAKAEVVGTYAPRVQINWWQTHSSASLHPSRRVKPLLTLAAAGQTKYRIVVEPMPRAEDGSPLSPEAWGKLPNLRPGEALLALAVGDLQRCLKLMSDATLPVTSDSKASSPTIRLRLNNKRQWSHPGSYHLFTSKGDVLIESGHLDGLRQGVYGLLTDHLDCHWFFPGQMGEEIPRPANHTVVIGQINDQKKPSFFSVGSMSWGSHPEWDRRTRSLINRGRMSFGHAWASYITPSEESYKQHPDWWARDRQGNIRRFDVGWSGTNFCSTSPEVIESVAKKVNDLLKNPDTLVGSIDPVDYAPMCLCDRCLALDAKYGVTNQDGTYVTDRLLHFSKEIYNRLEPQNRDKYLGILIYAYQIELPKSAVPHPRHAGMICNMDWKYDHTRPFTDPTSPQNREFLRLVKGWGKLLSHSHYGFYDYYAHWKLFGPWGLVQKMREDLPAFRDYGGDFLMIEADPNFGIQGLNLYIASQLAHDVDADVDVLLEEFFAKFYGPAAAPMRKYWLTMERHYALTRPGPNAIERVATKPELWRELEQYLKAAEASVTGAPQRFRDRIAFHRDGFDLGYRQFNFNNRFSQLDAKLDYTATTEYLKEMSNWLGQIKKKYPSPDGYWPTVLTPYFFIGLEQKIAQVEARATAQKTGVAVPIPPSYDFEPQE